MYFLDDPAKLNENYDIRAANIETIGLQKLNILMCI